MKNLKSFFKIEAKTTKLFYFVIFLIVMLFVLAYIHNNNIAYIVMFFLFTLSLISLPIGRKNINSIKLTLKYHPKLFANSAFKYRAIIENCGFDINIRDKKFAIIKQNNWFDLEYKFTKRGINIIKSEEIYSLYPLSLVKFTKKFPLNKEVLVYPELKGESLEDSFFNGNSKFGYKDDFEGLKRYSHSDSLSDIHWASVAKGEMASKKFSYISKNKTLIFDYSKLSGDKESKLSQIALWSVEADKKGYKYLVKLNGKILKDLDEILEKLALY